MTEFGKRTVRDLEVAQGERVLARVDFNVPLEGGRVADDARIRAALPTIELLLDRGARLILCSHLGRPKGRDPETSLAPVSERLGELIGAPVHQAPEVIGPEVRRGAERLDPGSVLVLENTRWERGRDGERSGAGGGAGRRSREAYVNDAFGAAHRAHASTAGVTEQLRPAVAGLLLEREVTTLRSIVEAPERPLAVVLGGAKVSDKIALIDTLPRHRRHAADRRRDVLQLLPRPGNADGRLAGRGGGSGAGAAGARQGRVVALPPAAADRPRAGRQLRRRRRAARAGRARTCRTAGWASTSARARPRPTPRRSTRAGTVFWNGPMGAFELEPFAGGHPRRGRGRGARAGHDGGRRRRLAAALAEFGLDDEVDHLSTGGGASLELLEGKALPGVEVLDDA